MLRNCCCATSTCLIIYSVLVSCLQIAKLHKCKASKRGQAPGPTREVGVPHTCVLCSVEEALLRLEDPSQAATHACHVDVHGLAVVVYLACQARWQGCQALCDVPDAAVQAAAGRSELCIALEVLGCHLFEHLAEYGHCNVADFGCFALHTRNTAPQT